MRRGVQAGGVGAAATWILAAFLYSLRLQGRARFIVFAAAIVLAVAFIVAISVSRRRTALTLVGGRLSCNGLLGERVILETDRADRVVKLNVDWSRVSGRVSSLWLLIDDSERAAISLNRNVWDERQLEKLREGLGLRIEAVETPERPAQARSLYPGCVPWWAAHPSVTTLLAILMAAALILVAGRVTT
jgi:hypothetical protein